ncbi:hypothetical protein VNO77_29557 [Canavalia gladiata]|uniref:Transmembrane protein n=1 Tax=Canavalia gladiata TaxID=3824 RepID=A0AAN9KPJ1_CANGL
MTCKTTTNIPHLLFSLISLFTFFFFFSLPHSELHASEFRTCQSVEEQGQADLFDSQIGQAVRSIKKVQQIIEANVGLGGPYRACNRKYRFLERVLSLLYLLFCPNYLHLLSCVSELRSPSPKSKISC